MKNKLVNSFEKRLIIYIIISVLIMICSELVFWNMIWVISKRLVQSGYRGEGIGSNGLDPRIQLILLVVLGFLVFVLSFYFLINKHMKYIKTITNGMKEIAEGNFDVNLQVMTVDEFGQLARYMNQMKKNIQVILEKERMTEHAKNDMVSSVAHDLRTPLTSIVGYIEYVLEHPELDEATKNKYLEIAFRKAKYLEQLTNDLLGFVKLEHRDMTYQWTKLDLRQLMEQLMDEHSLNFENNGLRTEFSCTVDSILMVGDGKLLARLFENLLNNAMKYGKDGKCVRVELDKKGNNAIVRVINYGYIIPEKDLEKIFHKFYRVEQSRSLNTGGSGLGLAIAEQIVQIHKGTIGVQSDLRGTVFEVKLPVDLKENQ